MSLSTINNKITRAITITQPWSWATVCGFKTVENRTRPIAFRGRLAIHASNSDRWLHPDHEDRMFEQLYDVHPLIYQALDDERIGGDRSPYSFGAIVGSIELVACVPFDPTLHDPDEIFTSYGPSTGPCPEIPHGVWATGPWCYVLRDARRYRRPIVCRGQVSLPWSLSPELVKLVAVAERDLITDPCEPVDGMHEIMAKG